MTKTGKHCGKRRNCTFCAISSFVTMFSKSRLLQRHWKASIWGKGLRSLSRLIPMTYENGFSGFLPLRSRLAIDWMAGVGINLLAELVVTPFPHLDAFWCLCSRRFFENMATKEEICHHVFNYSTSVLSFKGSFDKNLDMFSKSNFRDIIHLPLIISSIKKPKRVSLVVSYIHHFVILSQRYNKSPVWLLSLIWHIFWFNILTMEHENQLLGFCDKEGSRSTCDSSIFSSPVHEVLKVSYCDRPMSGVGPVSSVNIFSSVTGGSTGMKLSRTHPLNVLTRIP